MISVETLFIEDSKAFDICEKHINESILAGVNYYIDTYGNEADKETMREFEENTAFADIFPKGFKGSRLSALEKIRDLIQAERVVELSAKDKFILIHCLRDYCDVHSTPYSIESATKALFEEDNSDIGLNIVPIKNIEDRFYVISKVALEAHNITNDLIDSGLSTSGNNDEFYDTFESHMGDIEDLSRYVEVVFEDMDYEMLNDYTRRELRDSGMKEALGLDV